jgi:hypothetical protein
MSTQYRLVQSGKTASGGCSAGQGSSEPVAPRIIIIITITRFDVLCLPRLFQPLLLEVFVFHFHTSLTIDVDILYIII